MRGLIRAPQQAGDLHADGIVPVVIDLEDVDAEALSADLDDADVAVFAAGAGPGSGVARKDTVDRGAAVLLADACERAGVPRLIQVSAMRVDRVRNGPLPGVDAVFSAYLRAKLEAEDDLRGRSGLAWSILRPGRLTDDAGSGRVTLAGHVDRGAVPRDDVAAVLLGMIDEPGTSGKVLELVAGNTPVADAIAQVVGG